MKKIKPYFKNKDLRGKMLGIGQFHWMKEANYIESKKGSTRGGHYHKKTKELFFIIEGKIKVKVENLNTNYQKTFTVNKMDIFLIEPYDVHTFYILEDAKWINVLSCPMNLEKPDLHVLKK